MSAERDGGPTPRCIRLPRRYWVPAGDQPMGPLAFRALVDLKDQQLKSDGQRYPLAPGMQVVAEIKLGQRTVLEYLLSPVTKAFQEAGRER